MSKNTVFTLLPGSRVHQCIISNQSEVVSVLIGGMDDSIYRLSTAYVHYLQSSHVEGCLPGHYSSTGAKHHPVPVVILTQHTPALSIRFLVLAT